MNLFVIATAATVSIDSFVAGFSLSLTKRTGLQLPFTVAFVTYLLCLFAALAATLLQGVLQNCVKFVGAAILFCLGIAAIFRQEEATLSATMPLQCFAIGASVGLDGAVATLSLVIQKVGSAYTVPPVMAATHFVTVWLGQKLATAAKLKNAKVFSALLFFALAIFRLCE